VPGGLDTLTEEERQRVKEVTDLQLERAKDLLTGVSIYSKRQAIQAESDQVAHK
jgi:ribosomal protein L7/L12